MARQLSTKITMTFLLDVVWSCRIEWIGYRSIIISKTISNAVTACQRENYDRCVDVNNLLLISNPSTVGMSNDLLKQRIGC